MHMPNLGLVGLDQWPPVTFCYFSSFGPWSTSLLLQSRANLVWPGGMKLILIPFGLSAHSRSGASGSTSSSLVSPNSHFLRVASNFPFQYISTFGCCLWRLRRSLSTVADLTTFMRLGVKVWRCPVMFKNMFIQKREKQQENKP